MASQRFHLTFDVLYGDEAYRDSPGSILSHTSLGQSMTLIVYPSDEFTLNMTLGHLYKKYDRDKVYLSQKKLDNYFLSLGLSYQITKRLYTYFNSGLSLDDSSFETSRSTSAITLPASYSFEEKLTLGLSYYFF